jgi:hypothetical protein
LKVLPTGLSRSGANNNLMNKFKWGNMNDPKIYLDENNIRMMTNLRNSFNRLANQLLIENKKDSAKAVLDRCAEIIPDKVVSHEYFSLEIADTYLKMNERGKGTDIITQAFNQYDQNLAYFLSLDRKLQLDASIQEEIQKGLFYLQKMERSCRVFGLNELGDKINAKFQGYLAKSGLSS